MAGANRKRLHLTDSLIRAQVLQVAPAVTLLTGWNLGLDTLGCRVLPKDRGYEELLLGRLGQIGLHDWQDLACKWLQRFLDNPGTEFEGYVLQAQMIMDDFC